MLWRWNIGDFPLRPRELHMVAFILSCMLQILLLKRRCFLWSRPLPPQLGKGEWPMHAMLFQGNLPSLYLAQAKVAKVLYLIEILTRLVELWGR